MGDQQLQLRSTVSSDGKLTLDLAQIEVPELKSEEVLVRVDASPINPSDLGLLFGMAVMTTAKQAGDAASPVITADVPPNIVKGRLLLPVNQNSRNLCWVKPWAFWVAQCTPSFER